MISCFIWGFVILVILVGVGTRSLCSAGAPADEHPEVDELRNTPLHIASELGHDSVVALLLEAGKISLGCCVRDRNYTVCLNSWKG